MLLINFVVAVFWYEHMIQNQFKAIRHEIQRGYAAHTSSDQDEHLPFQTFLLTLASHPETPIHQIAHSNYTISHRSSLSPQITIYERGYDTLEEIDKKLNSPLSTSPFAMRSRFIIFSLKNKYNPLGQNWIGVSLNTSLIIHELWNKEKIILLYIFFNSVILATIIFFRFRKIVFKPIDNLLSLADNYQLNDGDWTLQPCGGGEFDQLSQAMNAMIMRIEDDRNRLIQSVEQLQKTNKYLQIAQQETLQAEKLAATGRLAAGFAHEIGNPVTIIQGYLEILQQDSHPQQERQDFIKRSLEELGRIDALLFQLMNLSRVQKKNEEPVAPIHICQDLIEALKPNCSNTIQIILECDEKESLVFCDQDSLRQVLLNIFLNGIDAIKENPSKNGKIICNIKNESAKNTTNVVIKITDNGTGIEPSRLDNIFDPFFTTKPVGKGTGLGLSVAHRIIKSMQGSIKVTSTHGQNTTFTISIPLYTPRPTG
jgi:signal transduction histidine kinase